MSKLKITENWGHQYKWYLDAENMTVDGLQEFIRHLTEDYGHDYGTICHAVAAASIASANAVNHSGQGGITGFQAGAIMWEFIRHWRVFDTDQPMKMTTYGDMLYPQYEEEFSTISKDTWKWLQNEARKNLKKYEKAHPDVIKHWQSIVDGNVPFGYKIKGE